MNYPPPYGGAPYGFQPSIASERFAHDKFLINQKVLSLGSKYYIYDEHNRPLFFIDRPIFKLKAHIGVYEDESRSRKLLTVYQDTALAIINYSFTLLDENEQPIAYFKRQGWLSMLRRTWHIYDTNNQILAQAQEDSWTKALMRRLPYVEIIGDFMRTNFIITHASGQPLGEFIRRFTITDKYVMDLTADRTRMLDRRIAIALAILLDNLERR
jgi:uncharacterized protein YxjI